MESNPARIRQAMIRLYDRTLDVIVIGLVFLMLVLLLLAFADVVLDIKNLLVDLFRGLGKEMDFRHLVVNVLDVFVVIELFGTFVDYVRSHTVRLTTLLDVTVVFALREMLIKLYDSTFSAPVLLTLGGVILLLVVCRTITRTVAPKARNPDGRPPDAPDATGRGS